MGRGHAKTTDEATAAPMNTAEQADNLYLVRRAGSIRVDWNHVHDRLVWHMHAVEWPSRDVFHLFMVCPCVNPELGADGSFSGLDPARYFV